MSKRIIDYIREGRDRGFSDSVLKEDLLDNGFSEGQVVDAFSRLDKSSRGREGGASSSKKLGSDEEEARESSYKDGSSVPKGVKTCSILYYVRVGLALLFPVVLIVLSSSGIISGSDFGALLGLFGSFVGFVWLGISIPFAVLFFFVARGLVRKQKWSRIVAIIFSILGILGSISQFSMGSFWIAFGAINLVLNGFVAGYLIFSNAAKTYFE